MKFIGNHMKKETKWSKHLYVDIYVIEKTIFSLEN
jgi:hypothetical protein